MNKLWKVTRHEFKMFAANKLFIILTILGPFLIIAVTVLPTLLIAKAEVKEVKIGILGAGEELYQQISGQLEQLRIITDRMDNSRAVVDRLVLDDELYGYLVLPDDLLTADKLQLVTKAITDFKIIETLRSIIGQVVVSRRMEEAGFDPERINNLTSSPFIEAIRISQKGEKVKQDFLSAILTGIAFCMLLYMTILLYGQSIGRTVLKEKTSKTVEIMLSSVSEKELLFGKILGQAGASLLQYTVWIGMALFFIKLLGPQLGLKTLPPLSGSLLLYLIIFFILGFFLYASIYAALGSAAEDDQHLGQLSWPIIMVLVIPMVSVSVIVTSPNSLFSVFLSLFPMTSPIVMFIRIVISDPKTWQIAASIGILIVTVPIFILLAAKIFRVGILMTGKRFKLREILKWIKA